MITVVGLGSGYKYDAKRLVEDQVVIKVSDVSNALARMNTNQYGSVAVPLWCDTDCVAFGELEMQGNDTVRLTYSMREGNAPFKRYTFPIKIIRKPCHYGGSRLFFVCPRCGATVMTVSITGGVGCRHCLKLAYRSENADRVGRLKLKADKAERKAPWGILEKPKGMHWKTFSRLSLMRDRLKDENRELMLLKTRVTLTILENRMRKRLERKKTD